MRLILYIIAAAVGIYLLLVIPAGIGVLISERRFRKSHYRQPILEIIERYKEELQKFDESALLELCKNEGREIIEKDGVQYSVAVIIKKSRKNDSYKVVVSVGIFRLITFGHAETFNIKLNK